ncbi:alpha/beta hydrolase [candidate division CSSED10-310 bacterium]|uniref:Alpha/beta hydrolase n=1 Tax=candidate division CSSED10-310 bacterium TaxID=2855610 RepID=A0ABV6YRN7_UNCC1
MNEKTGSFTSRDNLELFYRHFEAEPELGRVVIAHGVGEHSGRYGNVVQSLVPKGLSIFALDHRGHGKSQGKKGHVNAFEEYLNDLQAFVLLAREGLAAENKLFLLGHSMGGLIALNFTLGYQDLLDGVIVSSPGLGMKVQVPAVKSFLGKMMSSIWPGLTLGNELDVTKISHDAEVISKYENDPLVHDRVSARWFTEFLSAMENANRLVEQIKIPILMQIAGDDHLVDAESSQKFFEKLTAPDKTLHVYDNLYHEIYNETDAERKKVLADLEKWLEAQLGAK